MRRAERAERDEVALRDQHGPFFGEYGGRYMPESLIAAIDELTAAYEAAIVDPAFRAELATLLHSYAGRPSPITEVPRFAEHAGGARVFLKFDFAPLHRLAVPGRQAKVPFHGDDAGAHAAQRARAAQDVHVVAWRLLDQFQVAPALPDQFAHEGERSAVQEAAARQPIGIHGFGHVLFFASIEIGFAEGDSRRPTHFHSAHSSVR